MWFNLLWVSLFFIIFSGKSAIVIEQLDELIKIKIEDENSEKRKLWIETDDPKIRIKELYNTEL